MILFYTGSTQPDQPQINADKSLGGFVSSSPVPNGRINNLFPTISKSDVVKGKSLVRMIALKNTTGSEVANIKIYTDVSSGHVVLKLAAVASFKNSSGQDTFEEIMDGYSLPYQATFDNHEGEDNCIIIDSIPAGDVIGIWIMREIDKEKFPEFNISSSMTGQQIADILNTSQNMNDERIKLNIEW